MSRLTPRPHPQRPVLFTGLLALLLTACPAGPTAPPLVGDTTQGKIPGSKTSAAPFEFGTPVFPDARVVGTPPPAPVVATPTPSPTPTPTRTPTPVPTPKPSAEPTLPPPAGVATWDVPILGVDVSKMHGADNGNTGTATGPTNSTLLNAPVGVVRDPGTNLMYIADTGNNRILKSEIQVLPEGPTQMGSVYAGAGNGVAGDAKADQREFALTARFKAPRGLAFFAGSVPFLYVVDAGNHCVRRVFIPDQQTVEVVELMAGTPGEAGYLDGVGKEAKFNDPWGATVDASGNVFVVDTGNHCIRKITPAQVVTTYAGVGGVSGANDGPSREAKFAGPRGVVMDNDGNMFVCDTGNHCIRLIRSSGQVTTFAGKAGESGFANGVGDKARFKSPSMIALAPNGSLYVSDNGNNRIRLIGTRAASGELATAGTVSNFAGRSLYTNESPTRTDGPGAFATFQSPQGIALVNDDPGDLWVCDQGNNAIRNLLIQGSVSTEMGSTAFGSRDGRAEDARFKRPHGLARDEAGNFYIADTGNQLIRKATKTADANGKPTFLVSTLAGSLESVGNDNGTGTAAKFNTPRGVAVDREGNVFVADEGNNMIRKITPAGVVTTFAGSGVIGNKDGTGSAATFNLPRGIAIDAGGNLYVADFGSHIIRKITPDAVVTTLAGTPGVAGRVDNTDLKKAQFSKPCGLAIDKEGRIYVADFGNNAIRLIAPLSADKPDVLAVATFAGAPGGGYKNEGVGSALFNDPFGVAVDAIGRVFVADFGNSLIRKIVDDEVKLYSGFVRADTQEPLSGWDDGAALSKAKFSAPAGLVVDEYGYVWVADTENNCIRRIH